MLCKSLLAGVAMAAALAVLTGTAEAKGMKEFHRTDAWVSYARSMTTAIRNA